MSHQGKIEELRGGSDGPLTRDVPSDDLRLQINLRLHLDEVAEVEASRLRQQCRRGPTRSELRQMATRIYEARRTRAKVFEQQIFGEPAWDMLLALYFMPARGEFLTVSGLCYAAEVALSTGLRWQETLTQDGLIERGPQGIDKRKQFMRLTLEGRSLMDAYLTRLYYCETPATSDQPVTATVVDTALK